jgi:hypothetical protein
MRDEFASKSFLAVTVAGVVLVFSGVVALAFTRSISAQPRPPVSGPKVIAYGVFHHRNGHLRPDHTSARNGRGCPKKTVQGRCTPARIETALCYPLRLEGAAVSFPRKKHEQAPIDRLV